MTDAKGLMVIADQDFLAGLTSLYAWLSWQSDWKGCGQCLKGCKTY